MRKEKLIISRQISDVCFYFHLKFDNDLNRKEKNSTSNIFNYTKRKKKEGKLNYRKWEGRASGLFDGIKRASSVGFGSTHTKTEGKQRERVQDKTEWGGRERNSANERIED